MYWLIAGIPVCRIFGTKDATILCDELMPTLHERCRVIGAKIVAHEKQDFHLSSLDNRSLGMAQSALAKSALNLCPALPLAPSDF
jgi:hypothetical protein